MAWYKTGTITVTNGSTAVTGSGTDWVPNAQVGEALYAPDGKLYEITNVVSDTVFNILPAYLGSTASAQSYVIVPSQSYLRDLAAQAADLVNNYSTVFNTVGQGKFNDGTLAEPGIRFSADTDTGFFRSAANEVTFVAGGTAVFKYSLVGGLQFTGGGNFANLAYTGTLTGGTGVVNIGSGQLVKDAAGNLGLGVTPSAWDATWKVLQANSYFSAFGGNISGAVQSFMSNNAYFGGGSWKGGVTGSPASLYQQFAGQHQWHTASNVTANTNFGFTQAMTLDASANLLVGTTTAGIANNNGFVVVTNGSYAGNLYVNHNNAGLNGSGYIAFGYNGGVIGSITQNGTTAVAYNTSSDYRLKENVAPMTGALATVAALKPVTYTWKADGSAGQGFIAHELQAVVPDCVTGEKDAMRTEKYEISPAIPATYDQDGKIIKAAVDAVMGEREVPQYQGVDTSFLVATLVAAIQELKAEVDALKGATT